MTTAYLALDQGTTSTRAAVFDTSGCLICLAQKEFKQIFPQDGWVEHDLEEIWQTCIEVIAEATSEARRQGHKVKAMGITNQRETTCIWNRDTGIPVYNAIVWQDRRTSVFCGELSSAGHETFVSERSGLLIDPYFSASKVRWILDNVPGARQQAERGDLAFGTIETFLIWRLTGGKFHLTDATNAARTSLFDIRSGQWDRGLCELFDVPEAILGEVRDCTNIDVDTSVLEGDQLKILSSIGDQQSAAVGQACFEPGDIKSTYGTGGFLMLNTGDLLVRSSNRLVSTIGLQVGGTRTYALEGSIFVAGAVVQWLRDGMGLIKHASETSVRAQKSGDDELYMVPAFTGLGAPWWVPEARGAVFGITRDTGPNDFIKAALDSVAYQTCDLFDALACDGVTPKAVRVDGGMATNDWFLQRLSDLLDLTVERPSVTETTAVGVAMLAALADGVFSDLREIGKNWQLEAKFQSTMSLEVRRQLKSGWGKAIERTKLRL
jgi:glycerol kinase